MTTITAATTWAEQSVWIAVRASLRTVVDELTLADVVAGRLPSRLKRLIDAPDAWSRR